MENFLLVIPACQCNSHSKSCHYNATLDHGICNSCKDGTTGIFCENCDLLYYRNFSLPFTDEKACVGMLFS